MSQLVTCPDCGNEVSRNAKACPRCGRPIAGPTVRKTIGWVIATLVLAPIVSLVALFYLSAFLNQFVG